MRRVTYANLSITAAFCSPVPVPANGAVQGYRYELGATLRITCNEGYNMVPASSAFRTCIADGKGGGKWSETDPVCECKGFMISTYWLKRRAGRENFWLEVMTYWPSTKNFPFRSSQSVNIHFIIWPLPLSFFLVPFYSHLLGRAAFSSPAHAVVLSPQTWNFNFVFFSLIEKARGT